MWGGVALCTFLTALQNIVGFFECNTSRSHYQVLPFRHRLGDGALCVKWLHNLRRETRFPQTYLLQGFVVVLLGQEVDVSRGDDAHQLAAHFPRLRDGNAGEAVSCFGFDHVPDCVARTHHQRVGDETLLEPLKNREKKNTEINICWPSLKIKKRQTKQRTRDRQQN